MNDNLQQDQESLAGAIAIIGMDGRFPGAADIGEYWDNLLAARETIDRYEDAALDPSIPETLRRHRDYVRARGRMPEADRFDAAFFGVAPREAEVLDPQQRVFLEMCWRALEDAGYPPGMHDAVTGVFAGMSVNTYFNAHVAKHPDILASFGEIPAMVANERDYLATRVGYKLDLRGPCINISTACSTSLVAVCHAVNSLLDYQCDIALAGGVAVSCPQERGYLWQEGSIHAQDGHCRPFDAAAAGTVFSNGGGVVVLKRLADALADNDTIHAVIRAAAMNNDGADRVSFTAPSVQGQAEVVQMAQEFAGISGADIGYVEAHGTGTSLGDPIEIAALARVFRRDRDAHAACALGSVKGNIGHLDVAAGIAGLIKATLVVREGRIPPTLHFSKPNPDIRIDETPFHIPAALSDWPVANAPRRAAVSSFGLGGTNAHVILEEPPRRAQQDNTRKPQLLVLSAKSETALENARAAFAGYFDSRPAVNFADAAWTLQHGRQAFEHRLAVVATDAASAAQALKDPAQARHARAAAKPPHAVFMFPGQGSQYAGMCEQLYHSEALIKETIDACADALAGTLAFDLRDVMFARIDNAAELLDETRYTQPALFAVELALARWWMQRGVQPDALIGHSIGEFVAATLAGVFRVEDAARLVAERGRLMQECPTGSMLSVRAPEADIAGLLSESVTLAAINAPALCVLSGSEENITRLKAELDAKEIVASVLRTSHAFHSAMMDPVVAPFEEIVRGLSLSPPSIDIFSTVTGRKLTPEEATSAHYWARQLREPVRFLDALRSARDALGGVCAFIESGPGVAAATFAAQAFAEDHDARVFTSLGKRKDNPDEAIALLDSLGRLWTHGVAVDWYRLHGGEVRGRVPLPTYRFERVRHWLPSRPDLVPEESDVAPAVATEKRPLIEQVTAMLAEVSGVTVDAAHRGMTFAELGLDSLFLTQFGQALKKRFGLDLRFRQLLVEHNTLPAITALIEEKLPEITKPVERPAAEPAPAPRKQAQPAPALTNMQRDYIRDLVRRYTWRTSGSKAFVRTHRSHLADPSNAQGFDPLLKEMIYPIVAQSSSGSRIQDVDGNSYIDLVNGFGSNLLGHSAPAITDAIRQQLKRGYETGPQTPLAGRVARLLQAMTGFERVSFCTTGAEAVQAALRIALRVTQRNRVVMFGDDSRNTPENASGGFDEVPDTSSGAPGIPGAEIEVLEYGSEEALRRIKAIGSDLAAVLVEPVQARHPERYSPEFLRSLRTVTRRVGAALIFDEIVTGFRVHPGGMQALSGVRADLATYGKVCGGGMPIGVLAGEQRFMDALDGGTWQYNDDSAPRTERAFFSGTQVRHPLALAAAEAVLATLLDAGPSLQRALNERTAKLVHALEEHCAATRAPVSFRQFSSWFLIDIDPRVPEGNLLYYALRAAGIHVVESRLCFLSVAHSDADLAQISHAFRDVLDELRAAGFFAGIERPVPKEEIRNASLTRTTRPVVVTASAKPPAPGARLGRRPDGEPGWFIPDPDRPGRYRELAATKMATEMGSEAGDGETGLGATQVSS